ncbi:putative: hypothetical protein [Actinokineospora spheciospongiae]|uniref:PPE domain-containing protein n=1 Tax=Actinokineospora spheciospongiae TaxID=909613 RepID=W7JDR7_9PSEU|nr:PPE domain-containing protein [Actinokineospora spheciospongiae]EWC64149.1 putative: hypothetical protein [Actinokineospora spheciospongiae]
MFETVEDLAGAVTSVLSPGGPLGTLARTLTDALDSVWAEFFGTPVPPGGTNWNAYSHEQLHRMLWEGADVGDVGAVAAEWGRHGSALTGFADALRREADALRANWQGPAAGQAADRLAELSDRVWNAGARASTVQKAADDAGAALATARNTMPPPPPDPMTLVTSSVGAGPLNPLHAVLIGGARIFTADAVAGVAKAQAVGVMRNYEASLNHSGTQVVPAGSGATTPRSYEVSGVAGTGAEEPVGSPGATSAASAVGAGSSVGRGGTGGVPWSRLVGGTPPGSGAGGLPDPGRTAGVGPVQGLLAAERAAPADAAAKRAAGIGGLMAPPMGARPANGDQEKDHRTRLPNVDTGLFALDQRASGPVIGGAADKEQDSGL